MSKKFSGMFGLYGVEEYVNVRKGKIVTDHKDQGAILIEIMKVIK